MKFAGLALVAASSLSVPAAFSTAREQLRGSRVAAAPNGRGGVGLQGGVADSEIVIRSDDARGEMVITDRAGVAIYRGYPGYGEYCNQISDTRVRCQLFEPGGIRAALGEGDDAIEAHSTHQAPIVIAGYSGSDTIAVSNPADATTSRLQGNSGADTIVAGPSDDHLRGGGGADILRGNAGEDLLSGKHGPDAFIGGSGDDRIKADDGDVDRAVRCGSGIDTAEIDRGLDPTPIRCERVIRD